MGRTERVSLKRRLVRPIRGGFACVTFHGFRGIGVADCRFTRDYIRMTPRGLFVASAILAATTKSCRWAKYNDRVMPSAFPSHQGLILPILRLWPRAMDVLPLCVGAAMPDLVDGVDGMIRRGSFGQAWGHTLVGSVLLCVPMGVVVTRLIVQIDTCFLQRRKSLAIARRFFTIAAKWESPRSRSKLPYPVPARWVLSLLIGAISHIAFDCISHEHCRLLAPFREEHRCFPAGWYEPWFFVPLPGYSQPYPFAPHTVAWCVLTVVGALLYFIPRRRS